MNHMDYALYDAVIKDNIELLKDIEGRLNVSHQRTPTKSTVLHLACEYGNMKCVERILRVYESLLFEINSRGETALHLAARHGRYQVVVALIDAAHNSSSPHQTYFQNTSATFVQILIRTPNIEFETALHAAVRYNHNNVVRLLVTEDQWHQHPRNKYNETPLYMASIRRYNDIITTILDYCKSPTFGGPHGQTALHAAVLDDGGYDTAKLLLEKNKDLVKIIDNYGWTAFHYVSFNNFHGIVNRLVRFDKSAGYLVDTEHKRTPLHVAAHEGNLKVMKELVKYFPDSWDMVDGNSQNILHIGVLQRQLRVIRYIWSSGFETRNKLLIQRDKEGNTPLHLIVKLRCYIPNLADLKTVDWDVLNDKNLTPLQWGKSVADQAKVRRTLGRVDDWIKFNNFRDIERGRSKSVRTIERVKEYKKTINTHMIVAALISTVALTAGFAMPGGFDDNNGPTQGSPMLLRKTAFKMFMVTDAIALLFSMSSLFIYFVAIIYRNIFFVSAFFIISVVLNLVSIIAIMVAFITGTYAVLAHSLALAITVCVISSFFFLLFFTLFFGFLRHVYRLVSGHTEN